MIKLYNEAPVYYDNYHTPYLAVLLYEIKEKSD
jgi:hypothetical protein